MSVTAATNSTNSLFITRWADSCFSVHNLSDKVARYLVIAREKTVNERESLLSAFAPLRESVINDLGAMEVTLQTQNHQNINGLHFPGSQKKAIIYLHGNGCFYETSLSKPLSLRDSLIQPTDGEKNPYPHLLVFNPRGTGKSEGITHPDTVAQDIFAAFEYLVNNCGIDPNDIVIIGHSMGAFFSAFGAALVQRNHPDCHINFISDRSFCDIHSRVDAAISRRDHTTPIKFLASMSMHRLINWTNWNRDTLAALESLKGRVCIVYHEKDEVVPYDTSVHKALTGTSRSRPYHCLPLNDRANSGSAHNREFSEAEHRMLVAEIKRMLRLPLSKEEEVLPLDVLDATSIEL